MITCWNCGQRLEDIHQLSGVRLVGICLFGHCPRCGKDVPCRELIKIKQVIDLRGKNNERIRKNNGSEIHDLDAGNTGTSIQGCNPDKKTNAGKGSKMLDLKECLGVDNPPRPSNYRKGISAMVGRDRTQRERNVT